ncbi:glycoside hydrolase family 28 protein [Catenulispora rubra]|uniref:glycoside hydrolase family 28 protein n=1 Tax=Catenulispora rubra TaxID=280293 RepID=UPI0018927166|nr:glycosyl hydrolase family 28 protein [Catenulispora rubra]
MSPRTARRIRVIGIWSLGPAVVLATAATYLLGTPASAAPARAGAAKAAPVLATGDSRSVSEPSVPSTVCATVPAQLTISGRTFSSSQESNPPDTSRIQQKLDSCTGSSGTVAVKLVTSGSANAFLSGPLTVHAGEVLLIDSGATLYGSRNPATYQVSGKPTCGTLAGSEGGCKALIQVSGANAGIEGVQNASGHQGTIDGRGDTAILGGSTTWWQLADQAKAQGLNQQNPRLVEADSSNDFTMYHVNLVDSPNFHVVYKGGNGFTAWGVRIKTPANARNTDGIDPSGATNVTIADSFIQDGDDGIAVKGGSAASNMTIRDDYFWGTHGISIGSETNGGVRNILFENDTLNGVDSSGITSSSDNGIRIKSSPSNGGVVTQVSYLNTCLSGMKAPIVLDTRYSGGSGSSIPSFTDIVINGVLAKSSSSSATSVLNGYNSSHPLGVTLENVRLDVSKSTAEYAQVQTYVSSLMPSGTGVTVTGISGSGSVPSCTFPGYPAL